MPYYEVAGLIIKIESNNSKPLKHLSNFLLKSHQDVHLDISIITKKVIEVPSGDIVFKQDATTVIKKTSDQLGFAICIIDFSGKTLLRMDVEQDWRKVQITCCDIDEEGYFHMVHGMIGVAFRYALFNFDGLVIHSSTLKWNGKGLMFSAPSGTGKSTHVKLWQKYLDDVIVINDDSPAIRMIDNKPYVYGTPWCGSKSIHSNDFAPLAAIVLLEQAPNNMILRLNTQKAVLNLLPRVFSPYFDQNMMRKCMNIFERIMVSIPIYLLQCRPDKEAMELVYQCVK